MTQTSSALCHAFITAALLAAFSPVSHAQSSGYPDKPIRLIVGFVAGGPSDLIARATARGMSASLGQPIVVENKPGADANIAMEHVARAAPDGYTLMLAQSGMTINPAMYDNFKLRPAKDFTAIGMIGESANVLVINSTVPARSVEELVEYARAHPGKLNFAATSSPTRLATEMLNANAQMKMVMIPYKGTPPAITDLIAGNVQVLLSSVTTLQPHRQDRRLRFLATTGSTRAALMGELPTIGEKAVPGFDAVTWYGIAGPANLPVGIVQKLEDALKTAASQPEWQAQMRASGVDLRSRTSADFASFLKLDLARWAAVVSTSGAKAE